MAASSPWPTIHEERAALAADLEGLSDEQWATPSLCTAWSVCQVLGHMTAAATTSGPGFLGKLIASGFRFNALAEKDVARQCEGTPADMLARIKAAASSSKHPPGPVDSW